MRARKRSVTIIVASMPTAGNELVERRPGPRPRRVLRSASRGRPRRPSERDRQADSASRGTRGSAKPNAAGCDGGRVSPRSRHAAVAFSPRSPQTPSAPEQRARVGGPEPRDHDGLRCPVTSSRIDFDTPPDVRTETTGDFVSILTPRDSAHREQPVDERLPTPVDVPDARRDRHLQLRDRRVGRDRQCIRIRRTWRCA